MVLCRVTWPNKESLHSFTIAKEGSFFPARESTRCVSISVVLSVGNEEESPEAIHFKFLHLSPCFYCPVFSSIEEAGYLEYYVQLKFGWEADVFAFFQMMFSLDIVYMAIAILVLIYLRCHVCIRLIQ